MLRHFALISTFLFHYTFTIFNTMQRKIFSVSPVSPSSSVSPVSIPAVQPVSDTTVLNLNKTSDYSTDTFIYDEWLPLVNELRAQGFENHYKPWGIKDQFSAVDWIGHQIPLEIIQTGLIYSENPSTKEIEVLGRKWFSVPSDISLMQLRIMPDTRSISTPDSVRCFIEFKYILEGTFDNENNSIAKFGRLAKGNANPNCWGKWRLAVTFNSETVSSGLITQEDLTALYTYYQTMVEYQNEFYTSTSKATPENELLVTAIKKCVLRLKATDERKKSPTFFFQLGIEDRVDPNGDALDQRVNVTNIIWVPGSVTLFGKIGLDIQNDIVTFNSYNEGGNRPSLPLKLDHSEITRLGLY